MRNASGGRLDDFARELDCLVLMGGSDVCPETYGEKAIRPEWNGDRVRNLRGDRAGHASENLRCVAKLWIPDIRKT